MNNKENVHKVNGEVQENDSMKHASEFGDVQISFLVKNDF